MFNKYHGRYPSRTRLMRKNYVNRTPPICESKDPKPPGAEPGADPIPPPPPISPDPWFCCELPVQPNEGNVVRPGVIIQFDQSNGQYLNYPDPVPEGWYMQAPTDPRTLTKENPFGWSVWAASNPEGPFFVAVPKRATDGEYAGLYYWEGIRRAGEQGWFYAHGGINFVVKSRRFCQQGTPEFLMGQGNVIVGGPFDTFNGCVDACQPPAQG